ncbi:substrate-binding protein [Parafrankia irregularis]|uniref:Substrate-binding protein n=1 Tax=Parafrankia irregularis TaxID=795642 RepID=A0A0S4QI86_9ACTN|nr:ABC transporter substrate-binding protein [Parafrankia sp. CH37]CUU54818.1 substrate-binding protein [Parafrankia irregularis]
MEALSQADIPMVSSAQSGDDRGELTNYFRISPANWLQAQLGADWIAQKHPGARTSLVLSADDDYSTGLAGDYRRLLAGTAQAIGDDDSSVIRFDANDTGLTGFFAEKVRQLCESDPDPGRHHVLIYTGRANEAIPLVSVLGSRNLDADCAARITVVGGDDITQTEEVEMARALEESGAHVYFTTFGTTATARGILSDNSQEAWNRFGCDYQALKSAELDHHAVEPGGHIQVAYDVFGLLAAVTRQLDREDVPVTRDAVREKLPRTRYEGMTGEIDLRAREFVTPPWRAGVATGDVRVGRSRLVVLQELEQRPGAGGTVVTQPVGYLSNGGLSEIKGSGGLKCRDVVTR